MGSLGRTGREGQNYHSQAMKSQEDPDKHHAAAVLSTLLPRTPSSCSPPSLPHQQMEYQEYVPITNNIEHEVLIDNQPYRTTPLVLPHAKTIHDTGEILYPTSSVVGGSQPYRNSALVMAAPRTIHEVGVGAGPYKPYRGPQYYTDKKQTEKAQPVYNSPLPLDSTQTLTGTPATITESATQQMVLRAETGDHSAKVSGARDPVMRDSSINQSASFKKVMHSVMGNSEF